MDREEFIEQYQKYYREFLLPWITEPADIFREVRLNVGSSNTRRPGVYLRIGDGCGYRKVIKNSKPSNLWTATYADILLPVNEVLERYCTDGPVGSLELVRQSALRLGRGGEWGVLWMNDRNQIAHYPVTAWPMGDSLRWYNKLVTKALENLGYDVVLDNCVTAD